jgi:phosphatidate cytidylyltransferase
MLLYTLVMDLFVPCYVNYLYALIYGLLGSLAGVFGDLCFSAVKRQTGIKDYGNLIPGHGGALDRFDSMVTVAPLMEVMLTFIPLVVK